ncbi:hypothetical protein [Salinigranum sp. GCM10025319]|uniref:hypothetical protein n=1 Tax=Salinigranum sp. GCM10025319 TaxID=3252687 RepID=UPI00362005FB
MRRRSVLAGMAVLLAGCGAAPGGTPTASPTPTSEWRGPTEEDRAYVDLRYRDWLPREVESKKRDAIDVAYEELSRNVDEYVGQTVYFRASTIRQVIEADGRFVFFIEVNHSRQQPVYASWTGDRFVRGERVAIWGHVTGTERYAHRGQQVSVPALSLVDVALQTSGDASGG